MAVAWTGKGDRGTIYAMIATVHALVGGAIAAKTQDPLLALPLSLISHFMLDAVPHWDFGTNWKKRSKAATGAIAITETLFGIGLSFVLFSPKVHPLLLLASIAAAELPDWIEAPWYIFFAKHDGSRPGPDAPALQRFLYGLYAFQNQFHTRAALPLGIITQVIAVGFFMLALR
jgi:hypothetical protein